MHYTRSILVFNCDFHEKNGTRCQNQIKSEHDELAVAVYELSMNFGWLFAMGNKSYCSGHAILVEKNASGEVEL